ncbi:MAG: AEC family transporter [Firmicutes bacterium]|nr:AEC family transporter [Bacillota bacterium]
MIERFLVVLMQVISLFLLMGAGFILSKAKLLTEVGTKQVSAILVNAVTPCLVVTTLQIDWDAQVLKEIGTIVLILAGAFVLLILASLLLFRKEPDDARATLRFGVIFSNCGYMGLPLVTAVLGSGTTLIAALMIVVFNFFVFTYGIVLMGGKKAFSPRALINPVIVSMVIGAALMLLRIKLPGPIATAAGSIASLNSPLAMITIGAQLARADLSSIFNQARLYKTTLIRNIIFPVVIAFLLLPLQINRTTYIALVILFGTPVAGVTSIFAEKYDRDSQLAAQMVSLTTILSIITLPLIAVLAEVMRH